MYSVYILREDVVLSRFSQRDSVTAQNISSISSSLCTLDSRLISYFIHVSTPLKLGYVCLSSHALSLTKANANLNKSKGGQYVSLL